jgi:hypothetical protein
MRASLLVSIVWPSNAAIERRSSASPNQCLDHPYAPGSGALQPTAMRQVLDEITTASGRLGITLTSRAMPRAGRSRPVAPSGQVTTVCCIAQRAAVIVTRVTPKS